MGTSAHLSEAQDVLACRSELQCPIPNLSWGFPIAIGSLRQCSRLRVQPGCMAAPVVAENVALEVLLFPTVRHHRAHACRETGLQESLVAPLPAPRQDELVVRHQQRTRVYSNAETLV